MPFKFLVVLFASLIITPLVQAKETPVTFKKNTLEQRAHIEQKNRTIYVADAAAELKPIELVAFQQGMQAQNGSNLVQLKNTTVNNDKHSEVVESVLPDFFNNKKTKDSKFGITGNTINSVDLRERGEVDGAEIQFHFRQ